MVRSARPLNSELVQTTCIPHRERCWCSIRVLHPRTLPGGRNTPCPHAQFVKEDYFGLAARPCAARQFPFFHYPVIRLVLQSRHEMHLLPSEPPKPIVIRISAIRRLVFLANRMTLSAATIAAIYKERWSIELFFKALKQSLRVKTFVGTSASCRADTGWQD